MTITVLPMDATAGAPAYSAKNARQAQAALYGNPTGRVFGTRSGWRVGTLSSIVSVTSTTWTLNPCSCMIEPAASLYQGTYGWASDAVQTGPITAADGTNPRIDILYIQVNDSSAGDGSGGLSAPVSYLAGVAAPSGTQVAPALPPRSFLVATIAVPKSGAGSPTVTLNQTYFVAAGAPVPVYSQTERDGLTPYDGLTVQRRDIAGRPLETWDGAKWGRFVIQSDSGWGFVGWSWTLGWAAYGSGGWNSVYRVINGIVHLMITAQSNAAWSNGALMATLSAASGIKPVNNIQGVNCQAFPQADGTTKIVATTTGAANGTVSGYLTWPLG